MLCMHAVRLCSCACCACHTITIKCDGVDIWALGVEVEDDSHDLMGLGASVALHLLLLLVGRELTIWNGRLAIDREKDRKADCRIEALFGRRSKILAF